MKKLSKLMTVVLAMVLAMAMALPVLATTPEFDQDQLSDATVHNTPPVIMDGYLEILSQTGALIWSNNPDNLVDIRPDSYIFESEKLIVYVKIHDDNGVSDLWEHTATAWLSPINAVITDLALVEFTNADQTEALFRGEKFMPAATVWQCAHDVYITDTDKYGYSADNDGLEIYYPLYINPEVSSTFVEPLIRWLGLKAGMTNVAANTNTHIDHVYAQCTDAAGTVMPITVGYILKIAGTDLEGAVGTSHVIPCENVTFDSVACGIVGQALTNGHVEIGQFQSCEDVDFNFFITVPWIEPGDYHGQVNLEIKVL